MCINLRIRSRAGDDDQEPKRARRTFTMPIFSRTNKEALPAIRGMVTASLVAGPSTKPPPARRAPSSRSAMRALPRIKVNGLDGGATADQVTSPVLGRTSIPNYDGHASGNVDLTIACMTKLDRAFDDIRRRRSLMIREQTISRDQFAAWLEHTQGEQPEDIKKYLPLQKERYMRGEFLETWVMRFGWDAERPLRGADKDTGRPITNYFISSSHNTYLDGNQLASRSTPEAYKTVLARDCRCIEIDVWNGDVSTPVNESRSKPSKSEHNRTLSGSSLPNVAASLKETVGGTVASVFGGDRSSTRSRSPSVQSRSRSLLNGQDSPAVLSPKDSLPDKLDSATLLRPSPKSTDPYPKNEPIVTHGWTLTTPCGFREVCVAIRESAFQTNDLPLIISLEVHADHQQQEVMVEIMKQEWGGLLLQTALPGIDQQFRVPSLDDLRGKILIKVKKQPKKIEVPDSTLHLSPILAQDEDASGSDDEQQLSPTSIASSPVKATSPSTGAPPKRAKIPICQALGDLAIYTHSEHFKRFETASKKPSHIYSIAESRILELHMTHHQDMFTHNKNYFMRAFPNGLRVDSSNPDPSQFWRKGVQMVALNWQYLDEGMMLNEGMFAGEQGWVLKPSGYLSMDKTCFTQADVPTAGTVMLSIAVLSGQHVSAPGCLSDSNRSASSLRPVVKCEFHVEKAGSNGTGGGGGNGVQDGISQGNDKFKLQTSSRKTDHPDWGDRGELLKFPLAEKVVQGLSFVRLKIEDDQRIGRAALLSWACIRLDRLRPGYRYVRLMDPKGRPIKDGKLLLRINKVVTSSESCSRW